MAVSLSDFLRPYKSSDTKIMVKDSRHKLICNFNASDTDSLVEELQNRTIKNWDIFGKNHIAIYLNDDK